MEEPALIVPLQRPYRSCFGVPVLSAADTRIFTLTFFGDCLACTFCHDACCDYGVDVSAVDQAGIEKHAADLESYLDVPRARWFTGEYEEEGDWPGGRATRTQTTARGCVFRNLSERGCRLHSFAFERGLDVHEIKPITCVLFPLTWEDGVLCPAHEMLGHGIICAGPGQGCYRSSRSDLAYYFGADLISELDGLERLVQNRSGQEAGRVAPGIPLPLVQPAQYTARG
jgi:Fe-S-cluster containining protein